ncbi:hypothetical protein D3C73_1640600 [compost metagenome]
MATDCVAACDRLTKSAASAAGLDGFTTNTVALFTTRDTGAKSRTGSYGRSLYSAGLMDTAPTLVRNSTDPSAGDLAT